jgi:pilus assembly protein CpaC
MVMFLMRVPIAIGVAALLMVSAVVLSSPARAQQTGANPIPDIISMPLNKGELYTLPVDVRDVLVANAEIADVVIKTPRLAYIFSRAVGDTNIFFLDAEGDLILRLELHIEPDLSVLRQTLASIFPEEKVTVTAANEQIIITGTVKTATAAESIRLIARRFVEEDDEIINMLQIKSVQQVLLRVRISEMQRSVVKELGFNSNFSLDAEGRTGANAALSSGKFAAFTAGGTGPPIGQGVNQAFFPNAFGTFQLQLFSGLFDSLSLLINYLERQGLVKTLAEPNLIAVSGENANFLVGGEFPVPSGLDSQGNIVIQFRQFGVVLTFTPVVLDSGLISLKISTEVSTLSFETQIVLAGVVVPGLSVNRAETTVEMPSGGSLVIAGLLQEDITDTVEGLPGLKDIPILGALFRSSSFQQKQTELVISVTPYLIRPISQSDVTLPTDGFAPASDFDRYLLGRLHKVYSKKSPPAFDNAKGLMGPIGYIME